MVNEYRKRLLEEQKAKEEEEKAIEAENNMGNDEEGKVEPANIVEAQQKAFLEQAFQDIKAPDPE